LIELVFVIVIIGILISLSLPKLIVTRDDALIIKAKTTIAALRTAISIEQQTRILSGNFKDINASAALNLLSYGLDDSWQIKGEDFILTLSANEHCVFSIVKNRFIRNPEQTCTIPTLNTF